MSHVKEEEPNGDFQFLKKKKKFEEITFEGGPGDIINSAVIIWGASDHIAGVLGEYQFLAAKFGRRDIDWEVVSQTLLIHDHRKYDQMEIKLSDGSQQIVFFDISEFFGKW